MGSDHLPYQFARNSGDRPKTALRPHFMPTAAASCQMCAWTSTQSGRTGSHKNGGTGQANEKPVEAADRERTASAGQAYPCDWDDISIGHLVIANEGAEQGWWEAIVIAREGDMLTMRWRDYPKQPKFVQHRSVVAPLNPGEP